MKKNQQEDSGRSLEPYLVSSFVDYEKEKGGPSKPEQSFDVEAGGEFLCWYSAVG